MLRIILILFLFILTFQLSAQVDASNDIYTVSENTGSNTITQFDVQYNDNLAGNSSCTNQSTIVTNVVNGVCVRHTNGKDFNYYPNIGYYGKDSFKYRLTGCSDGSIDEAWVYITITPINQAPIAADDYYIVNEDQIDSFLVQSNDYDRESGTLTSTILKSPLKGTASIPILTYIRYVPNANYVGFDTMEYRVCDNGIGGSPSLCDEAFVFIKILPKDDPLALVKSDTTVTTKEDSFICVNLSSMVLDVDNENNWVASGQTTPRNGTAVYNGQTVCYYPSANFNGKDSFIVLAKDTNNNTVLIKVFINVTISLYIV